MLTPAVFSPVVRTGVDRNTVCVIWRRSKEGCWDYFCRAPLFDVERIVWIDQRANDLLNEDYEVKQG